MNLKQELNDWLDKQDITGDSIGGIRRACFVPWDSEWNGIVRDETALREKPYTERPNGKLCEREGGASET